MPVPDKENEPWIMALPGLLGVLLIVVLLIYLVKAAAISDDPVVTEVHCDKITTGRFICPQEIK